MTLLENNKRVKTMLITGGANGLGNYIACHFNNLQKNVIVFDKNTSNFPVLRKLGIACYEVDLTSEENVVSILNILDENNTKVDVLVNNAGIIYSSPILNLFSKDERIHSYQKFKNVFEINVNALFLITSLIAEKMVNNRIRGNIINISSISAQGMAGQSAYSSSKAAVEALTRVWSKELAAFGIRSNAIAPGFIDVPSTHLALNPDLIEEIKREIPLGHLGEARNVADAISTIIDNDFINGITLPVDGGMTI